MKNALSKLNLVIVASMIGLSSTSFADEFVPAISARILPNAQILNVVCESPAHAGHDWSVAGWVEVLTESQQSLKLVMAVSRFDDEKKEASILCKRMKAAKALNKKLDVIFTKEESSNPDEEFRLDIKGAVELNALNPLYNG